MINKIGPVWSPGRPDLCAGNGELQDLPAALGEGQADDLIAAVVCTAATEDAFHIAHRTAFNHLFYRQTHGADFRAGMTVGANR